MAAMMQMLGGMAGDGEEGAQIAEMMKLFGGVNEGGPGNAKGTEFDPMQVIKMMGKDEPDARIAETMNKKPTQPEEWDEEADGVWEPPEPPIEAKQAAIPKETTKSLTRKLKALKIMDEKGDLNPAKLMEAMGTAKGGKAGGEAQEMAKLIQALSGGLGAAGAGVHPTLYLS